MMEADTDKDLLFSIIVPIYNNEADLEKCIDSILAQTYKDFELILVNDGSTDGSPGICDRFAERDQRVKVIHKEKNSGVVAARNDGLCQASGKYVYHIDGDDWIADSLLEEASQELARDEPPDIYAFCYVIVQDGKRTKRMLQVEAGLYDRDRLKKEVFPEMICKMGRTIQRGKCSATLCDKIISRVLLKQHYCRDTSLFRGEDSVCAFECMYFADKVYFSDSAMYFYNCLSASSTTRRYHADLYEDNKAVAQYLRKYLKAEEDAQITCQINAFEFRGLVSVVHQEVDYKHSVFYASGFLRAKCRREKIIFFHRGLRLHVYPYILLLNLRCFGILFLCARLRYFTYDIWRMVKRMIKQNRLLGQRTVEKDRRRCDVDER